MSENLLGVLDDEIPDEVRTLGLQDRVKWHTDRIRRHEPVFQFFEFVEHEDLDDEQLVDRLLAVRHEIRQIENKIHLRSSQAFSILKSKLAHAVSLMKGSTGNTWQKHFNRAWLIEVQMRKLCREVQADPKPYLKLHAFPKDTITGRTYASRLATLDTASKNHPDILDSVVSRNPAVIGHELRGPCG